MRSGRQTDEWTAVRLALVGWLRRWWFLSCRRLPLTRQPSPPGVAADAHRLFAKRQASTRDSSADALDKPFHISLVAKPVVQRPRRVMRGSDRVRRTLWGAKTHALLQRAPL